VQNLGPDYPRKSQPLHFYSRRWYDERVKARFEEDFKIKKQLAVDLDEPAPSELKERNAMTRKVYLEESNEFREEIRVAVEAEHVAAVRAWELMQAETPTKTPEELNA
jgi:hypothetical protein